jgi:hypothetical protein
VGQNDSITDNIFDSSDDGDEGVRRACITTPFFWSSSLVRLVGIELLDMDVVDQPKAHGIDAFMKPLERLRSPKRSRRRGLLGALRTRELRGCHRRAGAVLGARVLGSRLAFEAVEFPRQPSAVAFDRTGALLAIGGSTSQGAAVAVLDFGAYVAARARRLSSEPLGLLPPAALPEVVPLMHVGDGVDEVMSLAWLPQSASGHFAVALARDPTVGTGLGTPFIGSIPSLLLQKQAGMRGAVEPQSVRAIQLPHRRILGLFTLDLGAEVQGRPSL